MNTEISPSSDENAIHPKFIEALSSTSNLYGILWPHIISAAPWLTRRFLFRNVNHFFREIVLSQPEREYDKDKEKHIEHYQGSPLKLDLDQSWQWRNFSAATAGFHSIESFRNFCALVAIEPEASHLWLRKLDGITTKCFIWMSDHRDVIVECKRNPMEEQRGYCDLIQATGEFEKVSKLIRYFRNNHCFERPQQGSELERIGTYWAQVTVRGI